MKKKTNIQLSAYVSPVFENYDPKVIEDSYIDAYSEFAKGKSFCVQLYLSEYSGGYGFRTVVSVFESPDDLDAFIRNDGEDIMIETYFSAK